MNKSISLYFFTALLALGSFKDASAQKTEVEYEVACIGFYNVENLFDTLDTEAKRDDEFLPGGKNVWNSEKYTHKLEHLSEVIHQLGTNISSDGLAIVGVSEVETIGPLQDLAAHPGLKDRNYEPILIEGPDRRGIDVGLLYQPKYFNPTDIKSHTLAMEDTSFRTRDQLVVRGDLLGEEIHLIVAHWPSRSGGQKRSEPKRIGAAKLGKSIVDSILTVKPEAKIIYMGDLNDDPVNKSCRGIMQGQADKTSVRGKKLYNPMVNLYNKGVGSLAWRDTWNLFDQILLSPGLLDDSKQTWSYYTTRVFNKPFLTQKTGNFKGYPFRTFSGGSWTGGYSDHFPVYVVLTREAK